MMTDYADHVVAQVEQEDHPQAKLDRLLVASCRFFATEKERLELLLDLWAAAGRRDNAHSFLMDIRPVYGQTRGWLAAIIKDGIKDRRFRRLDPLPAASLILALIDGLLFQAALGMIDLNDDIILRNLQRTIMEGIAK
jgi:AcrR family transcriptional regulator